MITYCTNVHPGESWEEIFSNLKTHVITVKDAASRHEPFPIGLRLSHQAACELDTHQAVQFLDWLHETDCYVPTINGFPFGSFHAEGLKEGVYLPDWRSPDRVDYSKKLASLLGLWLPSGVTGSISTVPVGFKPHISDQDMPGVRKHIVEVLEHIEGIRQQTGKDIVLALEPEPGCWLETAFDVTSFFERMCFPDSLRNTIGVCFDCCHQAVEFETPAVSLNTLSFHKIRLGKIHISAGMRFVGAEVGNLLRFDEPRYLHQVVVRRADGRLERYNDISGALAEPSIHNGEEWRVHFHVPVYADRTTYCGTTRSFIEEALEIIPNNALLEIETYTWGVLPEEMRAGSVTESIVREIDWLRSRLSKRENGP